MKFKREIFSPYLSFACVTFTGIKTLVRHSQSSMALTNKTVIAHVDKKKFLIHSVEKEGIRSDLVSKYTKIHKNSFRCILIQNQ